MNVCGHINAVDISVSSYRVFFKKQIFGKIRGILYFVANLRD